jgi:ribonuclease P protein component
MYSRQTFAKTERLCNKKLIDKLFSRGKSFFHYPFKVIFYQVDATDKYSGSYPAKVLVSVSKRNFKKAVDRNRIKRLIREGYRKNKTLLYEGLGKNAVKLAIGIIFTGKAMPSAREVEKKIIQAIHRLVLEFREHKK